MTSVMWLCGMTKQMQIRVANMKSFKQFLLENEDFDYTMEKKHGIKFSTSHGPDNIHLHNIIVPKDKRKSGVGSAAIQDLNAYADTQNKRVTLTTAVRDDHHGTTSSSRLKKFYKRHGYVENKGRNKDFSLSGNMYREPKQQ